jgi:hypothetical protein
MAQAPDRASTEGTSPRDALVTELRAHPARGPLGALALDVLGRQAEGRTLFVGRELVRKRAEEHGVTREAAGTSLCNVLDLLERGAESERERGLLCTLAVLGLEEGVATATGESARSLVARAVRHGAWLELATDFALLEALAGQAEGRTAELVADELAQRVVDERLQPGAAGGRARARAALFVTTLAASGSPTAATHLSTLAARETIDPVVRAMVGALAPATSTASDQASLEGVVAPPPRTGARALLAWISGWALLVWAARAVATLLGRSGSVSLAIRGRDLVVRERDGLLGRDTGARDATVPLTSVLSASREVRHAPLPLYAGALAFAAGVLGGGFYLFEGLQSGELVLAGVGAGLLAAGVLADLAADAFHRARGAGPVVELVLPRGRVVRLRAPSIERADAFLETLRARLR